MTLRVVAHRIGLLVWTAALVAQIVSAQVITAPDKVDELEERAYTEGQAKLEVEIATRDPSTIIDINVYRYIMEHPIAIGAESDRSALYTRLAAVSTNRHSS